jgi:hypothetical protein
MLLGSDTCPFLQRIRSVSAPYSSPMISAFVFVSGIFGFISDSDKTCGKESDKACFRPFPFRFQP